MNSADVPPGQGGSAREGGPVDRFLAATPDAISTQHAGVLGVAAVTAQECLDTVRLCGSDTVFINGATGGTGTFAEFVRAVGTSAPRSTDSSRA